MSEEQSSNTGAENVSETASTTPDTAETTAEVPAEERTMGMVCHLAAFAGFIGIPFGNLIGPLIVWLIKKDTMPFVDEQGKESLNFQISLLIVALPLGFASLIPFVFCITLPILAVIAVVAIVFTILAAVAANKGEHYRYPYKLELIK